MLKITPIHFLGSLDKRASLEMVHKHGPRSKRSSASTRPILAQDQSGVPSIQSRLAKNPAGGGNLKGFKATTLPTESGAIIGTPKRHLTLEFEGGSGLTWTQCRSCESYYYKQHDPIFNPSVSTSNTDISFTSPTCHRQLPAPLHYHLCLPLTVRLPVLPY